jgi:hypothetical protein
MTMNHSEHFRIPAWLMEENWWMQYFSKGNTFKVFISGKKNQTFDGTGHSIAEAAKGALKGRTAANPPPPMPKKQKAKTQHRKFTVEEKEFGKYNRPCYILNDKRTQ